MGTTPAERLLCSECLYELDAMREEDGVCPECGTAYSKRLLRVRRRAVVTVGLAMIGWGMVAGVLVDVCLTGLHVVDERSPPTRFNAPFCFAAATLLSAGGVALLSRPAARSRRGGVWPLVVAVVFVLISLLRVGYWKEFTGVAPRGWLGTISVRWYLDPASSLATWLLVGAAAWVVARAAGATVTPRCYRLGRAVCALVILGVVLQVVRWWFPSRDIVAAAFSPPVSSATMKHLQNLKATGDALDVTTFAVRGLAMLVVGLAALMVRALWKAERA